ncbi:MAG: HD domain-containing protein [Negativicutes bacterium]|nr:HD domain-containing protein [Negativicutes bacterium]
MINRQRNLFAVMHIGSEQVSLQIVEYSSLDDMRVVEKVSTLVTLGEETFKTGKISFIAVREICELLKGYRRILHEYGVKDYRLLATTAIREAENQQYIIDQIRLKTGFSVEVVDMTQEIFYKYIALFRSIEKYGLAHEMEGILFVDISSGGLGLTVYQNGALHYQQNIQIGALRIKESFEKYQRESAHFSQALSEYINSTIDLVENELKKHKLKYLVLSGMETDLVLRMLAKPGGSKLTFFSVQELQQLQEQVAALNLPQLMQKFNLSEQRAEIVVPTLLLYKHIMAMSQVSEIVVSNDQFGDGLTISHIGEKTGDIWLRRIEEQIISLAHALGRKYQYDPLHTGSVEEVCLLLFDRLGKVHGLGKRERFLLKVAAILHDIGKFVTLRRHYFYSYRLIISTDIIGFSESEKALIANVAYYHSKGIPSDADDNIAELTPDQRLTLAKLAAIMRLADAIDRSHLQKATIRDITLAGDEFIITVTADEDVSLEEWTFLDKAEFFESVFGIKPILKRQAG